MGQGAYIFGLRGLQLQPEEAEFFAASQPWGFILFARNVESPGQLRRLTEELRHAVGREAPVLIDQEGGRVQRMGPPQWRQWLPPLDQAARLGVHARQGFYLRARIIADELRAVGIDANCSPCADLGFAQTHPVLRNRCLGTDAATVTANATATADGLLAGGVLPIVKHIPGHGRADLDSHLQLPHVTAARTAMQSTDFVPFRALKDYPIAMSAHIVFADIDPMAPATQSPVVTEMIRNQIGFSGLLMSDDLSMQALKGGLAQRTTAALSAGMDMILHCNGEMAEMEAVAAAAGMMTEQAQQRADRALSWRKSPDTVDIGALGAEFDALLKEHAND